MKADNNFKMTKGTKIFLALMPADRRNEIKSVLVDAEYQYTHVKRKMSTKSFDSDSSE